MGLDCTAYSHLWAVGKHTDSWCTDEDKGGDLEHIRAFAYEGFEPSMDGLPIIGKLTSTGSAYVDGGCYKITEKTEEFGFRAGSYGGYNQWRSDLATLFNPYRNQEHDERGRLVKYDAPDPDKPFAELIWFADNEGTIGPLAAAPLLADFKEHEVEYRRTHSAPSGEDRYYVERYRDWMHACELASQDGLIDFH